MAKRFDVGAALKDGVSQQAIDAYVSANKLEPINAPQVLSSTTATPEKSILQGNFSGNKLFGGNDILSNILNAVASPAVKVGQTIGGGLFAGGQAVSSALGNKDAWVNQQTGQNVANPFLSEKVLQQTHEDPLGYLGDVTKNAAALASYGIPLGGASRALPFLKGYNLPVVGETLAKFSPGLLKGGALMGAAQSLPIAQNAEDVVRGGLYGAAGAGVIGGGSKLLNKILGRTEGAGGAIATAGSGLRADVRNIRLPASPYAASEETAINKALDTLGIKGNPGQQYSALESKMSELGSKIEKELASDPKTIPFTRIQSDIQKNLQSSIRQGVLDKNSAQSVANSYLDDIQRMATGDQPLINTGAAKVPSYPINRPFAGKTVPTGTTGGGSGEVSTADLFKMKQIVGKDYQAVKAAEMAGHPLTPQQQVIKQVRQTLDDLIAVAHPSVKEATVLQSKLYEAASSLEKSRGGGRGPQILGTEIPPQVSAFVKDKVGNVLQAGGNAISGASGNVNNLTTNPMLQQILLQGGARAGGISQVNQNLQNENGATYDNGGQYNPASDLYHTPTLSQPNAGVNSGAPQGQFTPQMVAAAQLMLPPTLAARVKAAYEAQYGSTEGLTLATNIRPARQALKEAIDSPDINVGGPQNRIAQFQMSALGGAGVDQRVVGLNQKYALLQQVVVRALQGSRMSDQDIKMAAGYIPSILDTPSTAKTKLKNLDTFLSSFNPTGNQ